MNKKAILTFLFVAALFATIAQNALAYTVTTTGNGGTYAGYGPYQTGQGGEFTLQASQDLQWVLNYYSSVTKNVGTAMNTFQTFCIEENEYIYSNTTHSATISDGAISGGNNGAAMHGYDPISIGTAWLYHSFAMGILEGYNYIDGTTTATKRSTSASALQNALWWLEGEIADPVGNIFRNAVIDHFGSAAAAMADNNGQIGVAALNLWAEGHEGDPNYRRQDQLVVTHAPIPAAIWLFGAGLLGMVGVRRRFTV
jgi:hypothetical protein